MYCSDGYLYLNRLTLSSSLPASLPRPRPPTPQTDDEELYESVDVKFERTAPAEGCEDNSNIYVPMGPGTETASSGAGERQGLMDRPIRFRDNPLYGATN